MPTFRPLMLLAASALPLPLAACATAPSASIVTSRPLSEAEARFARDLEAFVGNALERLPAVPALSVAVARADQPIYAGGFGRADIEAGLPATADTRFYIASSTKSFLGLALALLDARGEIDLDWTLAELAPDIAFAPEVRSSDVTLRHLLAHTHGLDGDAITFRLAYTGEHDPATLWRLLARIEPDGEASLGTFKYGNIGYNVAALLVERRLGRAWQEIVETEVLEPLRLRQTVTRGLDRARAGAVFAAPYDSLAPDAPARLYLVKEDDTMQSAGGMYSSANDMARWLQVNLAAARGAPSPLPAAVVAATHAPVAALDQRFEMFHRSGYGLGWYSGDYEGETLFHSFGGFAGTRAHVSFMPSRDLGVAVLANDQGAGFILADVVAVFAYTWFAQGPEAANRAGTAMIDRIVERASTRPAQVAAERAERAQRPWRLSLPRSAYAGRYCNADYGTMTLAERDGRLALTMGRLRADVEPFIEEEAVRIEAVPGSGTVMRFLVEDGAVAGAEGLDARFHRCG